MPTPEPQWPSFAAPPGVAEAALHLRFAITPTGPALQHQSGEAQAEMGGQPGSAWHELTLAALLVCLMAEEAGFTAASEAGVLPDPRPTSPTQGAEGWLQEAIAPHRLPEPIAPILAAEPGAPDDDFWVKLLPGRPGPDTAWLLT